MLANSISWIKNTFAGQSRSRAVIAVSGGIDSAVSLTLLARALGPHQVTALLLPYADQSTAAAVTMAQFVQLPPENVRVINIEPVVQAFQTMVAGEPKGSGEPATLGEYGKSGEPGVSAEPNSMSQVRLGNIMARSRMTVVFDWAKKLAALVCGTENKSEHYLGYFTRFGDAASDLEPIAHLYKTQVRQLAAQLQLPSQIQTQAPSAGLWGGQTDEAELGFSYEVADQVLTELLEVQKIKVTKVTSPAEWERLAKLPVAGVEAIQVQKVINQVRQNIFKLLVPYVNRV